MRKVYYSLSAVLLLFLLLAVSRCSKGFGPVDTTLTVYPTIQSISNGYDAKLEGWVGYYFIPADTFTYTVRNLEDAVAGRFTQRYGTESFTSEKAEVKDSTWVRFSNIRSNSAMLMIVRPDDKVYAFRQMDFVDGIDSMSLPLQFQYWSTQDSVYKNRWHILMKELNPISEYPAYKIAATIEKFKEGSTTEFDYDKPKTWKGYYYLVDNENYTVKDLEDAKNKVLTPAWEGEEPKNAVNGATEFIRFISLPTTRVLLVVYNETYPIFAYRYYTAKEIAEGEDKKDDETNLTFRTHKTDPYSEAGWTVVPKP